MAFGGGHPRVTNFDDNSAAELTAGPTVDGTRIWVANAAANTVTELPPG